MPRKLVHRLRGPSEHPECSTEWLRISLGVAEGRTLEGHTPVEKAELSAALCSSSSQKARDGVERGGSIFLFLQNIVSGSNCQYCFVGACLS